MIEKARKPKKYVTMSELIGYGERVQQISQAIKDFGAYFEVELLSSGEVERVCIKIHFKGYLPDDLYAIMIAGVVT